MARFEPQPGDQITLKSHSYTVMPHPAWEEIAFGQEGRKAIVYQLKSNGRLFAFKVFKPAFREAQLADTCLALSRLTFPGLEVCMRQCLTRATAGPLVAQYPELEYAILMPWIEGSTWFDILFSGTQISLDESQRLARSTAKILSVLEQRGFAHCDIAGGNIVVNTTAGAVSLIDVEDMFGPGLPPPGGFPQGTAGYQHQASVKARRGQWCAEGDRFSAAILMIEMLTWHHPRIRQDAHGEHYFAEGELQDPHSRRYSMAVEILASLSPYIVGCFERAWRAPALAAAPALAEWARLLETVKMPALPAPSRTEEAAGRYQCLSCTAHFEEPIAGGRCPRCGGKQVRQAAVVSPATRRAISGFRCLDCAQETERPAPGGRCPYCGTRRIVQAVIQASLKPAPSASMYACPVCRQRFVQLAPGARCPYCATRIKAN